MDGDTDRLVRRIQRKLRSLGPEETSGCLTPIEVAALRVRLQRLRETHERFIHVGLSRYVTRLRADDPVPGRIGGECVATEV